MIKNILKYLILFSVGGAIYYVMEIIWRGGYSYFASFLMGGVCFILLGLLNEFLEWEVPLIVQMIIGSFIITIVEFVSGCIINLWLGLNQWDYSNNKLNILGQVCVPYMFLWFLLTPIGIILDDYMRYWFFGEEKPHYTIFKRGSKR